MATSEERQDREWLDEFPFLVRVHHSVFIDGVLGDGISLNVLMDELGPDSFLRTQERAQAGEPDINPRLSLARKADVRLSPESFAWLTDKFEDAVLHHGQLAVSDIEALG
jgi:hypothetical protein